MPPRAAETCRICPNPRHIYPNGSKSQYCQEHMYLRNAKRRGGESSMTGQMKDILLYMREERARDIEFVELTYPFAHGTTIKGLLERDWIFESPGDDGVRYKITGRGLKALSLYESRINRRDGICPRCETRPRHVRKSGDKDGFCLECLREIGLEKRRAGKDLGHVDRCCSRCHKRRRHQWPNGKLSTYCKHCATVLRRKNARKNRKKLLESIRAGGPVPPCKKCKQKPRRVFINSVSSYCPACGPIELKKSKLRKSMRKAQVKS
jgi:hypothetical protein